MNRLTLMVEGHGDQGGAYELVRNLISGMRPDAWQRTILDQNTLRIGEVRSLFKDKYKQWCRYIQIALKTHKCDGILAIIDGDADRIGGKPFCAAEVAIGLATVAKSLGAGNSFSLGVVIAQKEFESWLIAGVQSLAGKKLSHGRSGVNAGTVPPDGNLEQFPRDAKRWLAAHMAQGYKPTSDQAELSRNVDLSVIRERNMRSFRRFEAAVLSMIGALDTGGHIVSPIPKADNDS
jgi:hypothetical protein